MNGISLFKKEIRENRLVFVFGVIVLTAFAFINAFLYDLLVQMLATVKDNQIPGFAKDMLQMMHNFDTYIWYSWFGKNYYQAMTVLAIVLGMGLIAGEVSKETITFLLSKPYSRRMVYTLKYLAGASTLLAIGLVSTVFQYIAILLAGREYSFGKIWLGVINSFPGFMVFFSVAMFFSVIFNDRLKAGLSSAVIAIAMSVPGFFPDYQKYNLFKYLYGNEIIAGQGFPWSSFLILLGVSAAIYLAGIQLFRRKQF